MALFLSSSLQCSVSCDDGVMERTVQCVAADGQESNGCSRDAMPDTRKVCKNPSCEYFKKTAAQRSRPPGLRAGQPNTSIKYDLTWCGHLRDLASSEKFMIRGKHQRFTVQCIYFPVVRWDFKEWVAFHFFWFDAVIFHTWLKSWIFACLPARVSTVWVPVLC